MIENKCFDYAVIGAGPAGIAVVSQLLQVQSNNAISIVWIDNEWEGGYFRKVPQIPSNTTVEVFLLYLKAVGLPLNSQYNSAYAELSNLNPLRGFTLDLAYRVIIECLAYWKPKVQLAAIDYCREVINLKDHQWAIKCDKNQYQAKNVVLCTGAHPKTALYANWPLEDALNGIFPLDRPADKIAVIGNSHSGMLIVRHLIEECQVRILHLYYRTSANLKFTKNIYVSPDEEIMERRRNNGLQGIVAEWCLQHKDALESCTPVQLKGCEFQAIKNDPEIADFSQYDLVVAAIGFERNQYPIISCDNVEINGNIGGIMHPNGLYGFGIAFPDVRYSFETSNEQVELEDDDVLDRAVALWKFMYTIRRILLGVQSTNEK